jgi:cobalt-zinc-cadmium efflux system protein
MEQTEISERRTAFVVIFTFFVMVAELSVGFFSHSMALQADGLHMGSHVLVLGLNWGAFILVNRLQRKGTKKYDKERILNLSAWTSGIFLMIMAVFIITETIERINGPHVHIAAMEALVVAAIGLVANIICASVLRGHHQDLNSHAAYLHILSDVLTKIGVIIGLICAKMWHITFIDAIVAVIAAIVVIRWAWRLMLTAGKELTSV